MQADTITTQNEAELQAAPEPMRVAGIVPRAFWTPKSGNSETDYEDGWAVGADSLAIADGATESSFARLWAQALTAGFVAQPNAIFPLHTERLEDCRARIQEWTQPLQREWHSRVPWNNLPWFAEDKARAGAFATLLAFQIRDKERGENELSTLNSQLSTFQAFAIGDSCLFQIRDSQVKLAFPLTHSSQFDSTPLLLSSNPANNKRVWNDIAIAEGAFQAGDILLFATDALARWFLAEVEAGNFPWHELCGLSGPEAFEAFVTRCRQTRTMRNDDVTLVIVDASALSQTKLNALMLSDTAAEGGNSSDNANALSEPIPLEQASVVFAGTPGAQESNLPLTSLPPNGNVADSAERGAASLPSAPEANTEAQEAANVGATESGSILDHPIDSATTNPAAPIAPHKEETA